MNDFARPLLLIVVAVILVPVLSGVLMMSAMGGGMMDGGMGDWDGWGPWQGLFTVLSTLLIVGGIAAIAFAALRRDSGRPAARGEDTARRLLDQRYARGEVTREQYAEMRRDLET